MLCCSGTTVSLTLRGAEPAPGVGEIARKSRGCVTDIKKYRRPNFISAASRHPICRWGTSGQYWEHSGINRGKKQPVRSLQLDFSKSESSVLKIISTLFYAVTPAREVYRRPYPSLGGRCVYKCHPQAATKSWYRRKRQILQNLKIEHVVFYFFLPLLSYQVWLLRLARAQVSFSEVQIKVFLINFLTKQNIIRFF